MNLTCLLISLNFKKTRKYAYAWPCPTTRHHASYIVIKFNEVTSQDHGSVFETRERIKIYWLSREFLSLWNKLSALEPREDGIVACPCARAFQVDRQSAGIKTLNVEAIAMSRHLHCLVNDWYFVRMIVIWPVLFFKSNSIATQSTLPHPRTSITTT